MGNPVPHYGYVDNNIPHIAKYSEDILMLIIKDIPHGQGYLFKQKLLVMHSIYTH